MFLIFLLVRKNVFKASELYGGVRKSRWPWLANNAFPVILRATHYCSSACGKRWVLRAKPAPVPAGTTTAGLDRRRISERWLKVPLGAWAAQGPPS